jgi:hypothetical protein
MDIQRVHQTISFMLDEDRKLAIQQTLEQLAGMLGNLQSQPNLPQFQTQAASALSRTCPPVLSKSDPGILS